MQVHKGRYRVFLCSRFGLVAALYVSKISVAGVFTAPVKGVYYFRYSGSAFASHDMGLSIFKGTARFVSSYEYNSGERNDQMSNGAVMELDVGEEVHVRLWVRCWIFVDPRYNYSTFTGYLLYSQDSATV